MTFQKKVMILNDAKTFEGAGLIKFISDGSASSAEVNLQRFNNQKLTVLLKAEARLLAFEISKKATLNLGDFALPSALDCLIIDSQNVPLLCGSTTADKRRCFTLLDDYLRQKKQDKIPEKSPENEGENIVENAPETEAEIAENLEDISISETSKKQTNSAPVEVEVEASKTVETAENDGLFNNSVEYKGDNFYLAVKPQLDEMFLCYPADLPLQNAVPNSKWIRVATEDDYYVVGVIFELDAPKYVCYGIHGEFNLKPPEDIKNICEWLPLDLQLPEGEGYWMMYQSAVDGKTVRKPN